MCLYSEKALMLMFGTSSVLPDICSVSSSLKNHPRPWCFEGERKTRRPGSSRVWRRTNFVNNHLLSCVKTDNDCACRSIMGRNIPASLWHDCEGRANVFIDVIVSSFLLVIQSVQKVVWYCIHTSYRTSRNDPRIHYLETTPRIHRKASSILVLDVDGATHIHPTYAFIPENRFITELSSTKRFCLSSIYTTRSSLYAVFWFFSFCFFHDFDQYQKETKFTQGPPKSKTSPSTLQGSPTRCL